MNSILSWASSYKKSDLNGDIFAGLTVGVMLIPQGMAYALIAGLPPVYGLYASIVPQLVYALFGTSRQLSVAPVAMDSLLVAAGVSVMAIEGTDAYISFAILLAALVGSIQLVLGFIKLGFITNLLSKPVISGFTSAAAIIIALNQLKYLLGVDLARSSRFYEILLSLVNNTQPFHWLSLCIGIVGILLLVVLKKWNEKIPGALVIVVIGTSLVSILNLNNLGIDVVGKIPQGFPAFLIPSFSGSHISELIPLALAIAVVGYMEAFSVAKAIEGKRKDHQVLPNRELIALGAANLIGSFFRAFPVTGGFSRSAVNEQAGANTPLSSVISAALVTITLLFLTPLFYYLPKALLASVIMVAVYGLINVKYARKLWFESPVDFFLLIATFIITLNVGMVEGIVGGVVASILVLLYKSAYPHVAQLGRMKGHHEYRNIKRFSDLEVWENLIILRMDAPLTFINIQFFKDHILSAINKSPTKIEAVILDAGPISHTDASATDGLKELLENLELKDVKLLICDLIGPVRDVFSRSGLVEKIGEGNIFLDLPEAVRFAVEHKEGRFKKFALQTNDKQ